MIKLAGISVSIHPLLVIIMIASVLTGYWAELAALFAIVVVHELGHVIMARSYGWRIRSIKLLPFGGVAETEEAGSVPARQEAAVAAAGPLQNAWMAAAAWALGAYGGWDPAWAGYLVQANLMIGLFNLLPILPLDGGKLLQVGLCFVMPYHRALEWSTRISLLLSAAMAAGACLSVFGGGIQLNLLVVGLFLLASNWTFRKHIPFVFIRFLMNREMEASRRREEAGTIHPIVVSQKQQLGGVLRLLRRERYHLIYVIGSGGTVMDVMPEERVIGQFLTTGMPSRALSDLIGYNQ